MVLVSWTFLSVWSFNFHFPFARHIACFLFDCTPFVQKCSSHSHTCSKSQAFPFVTFIWKKMSTKNWQKKRKFLMMRSLTASASRPSSFDSNQRLLLQQCLEDRFLASNSSWNLFEQSSLLLSSSAARGMNAFGCWCFGARLLGVASR